MRKITLFFVLLFACIATSSRAQDGVSWKKLATFNANDAISHSQLEELNVEQTVVFQHVSTGVYLKVDPTSKVIGTTTITPSVDDPSAGLCVFSLRKKEGDNRVNTFAFESALSGYYIPSVQYSGAPIYKVGEAFVPYTINTQDTKGAPAPENQFVITSTLPENGDKGSFDMVKTSLQFVGWKGYDSNCYYRIIPVTVSENDVTMGTVTFNYQINGKIYTSIDVDCEIGSPLPEVPACDFVTILSNDFTGEFVTEASTIVNVTCEPDLPFTASASVDFTNATWYAIDIHSNDGNYYWKYVSDNDNNVQTPPVLSTSSKDIIEDNYLWCFVGNLFDGFKIYNKAAGDNMTLKWGTKAFVLSDNNDNNAFKILTASNGIAGATCFTLNGTNFINHQTDTGLHLLKTWTDRDKGSSCRFFAPSTFMLNCAEGYLAQAEAPAGAVGTNPNISDIFADLQSATDDVKIAPHGTKEMDTLSALLNRIDDNEAVGFENGGYYRIICADPNFKNNNKTVGFLYDPASSTPNYIRWGIINNNNINAIFQISSSTDNGYNIKNCNKGQYMQGVGGMLGSNTPNVDFIDLGGAQYNIHFSNGYCHANGHNDGQGDSGGLSNQIGNRNSPSAWYIIPATDIEIALNEGEGNYWASTYLPFGVSAQEGSDLQIYTGTVSGEVLHLEATETLSAETGAILKGTSGTCTLNIVAEETQTVDSDLQGTLTELPGINSGDYLVLGKAEGKVGLYTTNSTTLKANKAYLPASLVQGVNGLRFSFGEITGIDSAATEQSESKAALYDLSGRRVALPIHGIYVKDGKKILVR